MLNRTQKNIRDIITLAIGHTPDHQSLLVRDEQSPLSRLLSQSYIDVLPDAIVLNFDQLAPEEILRSIERLTPGDLVVLVQSTSFRLNEFRIRLELFNRRLKVIEHPHLARMLPAEYDNYIDALAYDPDYYRTLGPALKTRIDQCQCIRLISGQNELTYHSSFEDTKLNIGDYRNMKNIGGQFPIGEVFSEPKEISQVNGMVQIFAFGNKDFSVCVPEKPFAAMIENGVLISAEDSPSDFKSILTEIQSKEEKVWLRELGFGLNRALTRTKRVNDISAYERMCGIHLSLGGKHSLYTKPGFPKSNRFHVDVFVDTARVDIDGETVFKNECYSV